MRLGFGFDDQAIAFEACGLKFRVQDFGFGIKGLRTGI